MNETSLVPYVPEEELPPEYGRIRRHFTVTDAAAALLCTIALFFYVGCGIYLIDEAGLSFHAVVRTMAGDFAGGGKNVYLLPDSANDGTLTHFGGVSRGDTSLGELELIDAEGAPAVFNTETPYDVIISEMLSRERVIESLDSIHTQYGKDAPVVLILHTHGTEAYAEAASGGFRVDADENGGVIGIGSVIADRLMSEGIGTVHCKVAFDSIDFNTAYYSAALAIRDYLHEYPSIRYIIDIHRDSVTLPDGTEYALTAESRGERAAKIMFVVGTDYAGSGHVGWRDNLALCTRLEYSMEEAFSGIMRGLNIRAASFNQQYSPGSMLVEIGSCANTFDEAAKSAEVFAAALAEEIKQ